MNNGFLCSVQRMAGRRVVSLLLLTVEETVNYLEARIHFMREISVLPGGISVLGKAQDRRTAHTRKITLGSERNETRIISLSENQTYSVLRNNNCSCSLEAIDTVEVKPYSALAYVKTKKNGCTYCSSHWL